MIFVGFEQVLALYLFVTFFINTYTRVRTTLHTAWEVCGSVLLHKFYINNLTGTSKMSQQSLKNPSLYKTGTSRIFVKLFF